MKPNIGDFSQATLIQAVRELIKAINENIDDNDHIELMAIASEIDDINAILNELQKES